MTDVISALRLLTRLKNKSVHLGVTGSVACYKAIELMRALNFYRFSTPETKLNDIYLCGGGASIQPLCNTIAETVGMNIHRIDELVPSGEKVSNCEMFAQAIGITLEMGR